MAPVTAVDGRVARGARNREAIVDAILSCYADGLLRPSAAEIAQRAGVSARSLHNHFDDMEALRAEVAQRQWDRHAHLATPPDATLPLPARVHELVARRGELYERVTPVRRAALLSAHESPTIAANLARLDRLLRRQLEALFVRELRTAGAEALDVLDALLSWDTWNRLRVAQGCSPARARRALVTAALAVLDEGTKP
jgi:AcrR family transcriptional regulator